MAAVHREEKNEYASIPACNECSDKKLSLFSSQRIEIPRCLSRNDQGPPGI